MEEIQGKRKKSPNNNMLLIYRSHDTQKMDIERLIGLELMISSLSVVCPYFNKSTFHKDIICICCCNICCIGQMNSLESCVDDLKVVHRLAWQCTIVNTNKTMRQVIYTVCKLYNHFLYAIMYSSGLPLRKIDPTYLHTLIE